MKLFPVLIFCTLLAGCASTQMTGISDPKYKDQIYGSVVVQMVGGTFAQALEIEKSICNAMSANSIACKPFTEIYPPTREFDIEAAYAAVKGEGIETVLVMAGAFDDSSSNTIGYQSFGSATSNGFGTTYGQTTALPMRTFSRTRVVQLKLLDSTTRETVWIGEAITSGQGLANITNGAFNSSLVKQTVTSLLTSNHF